MFVCEVSMWGRCSRSYFIYFYYQHGSDFLVAVTTTEYSISAERSHSLGIYIYVCIRCNICIIDYRTIAIVFAHDIGVDVFIIQNIYNCVQTKNANSTKINRYFFTIFINTNIILDGFTTCTLDIITA